MYRQTLFSSLHLRIDSGLFVVNLANVKVLMFCFALMHNSLYKLFHIFERNTDKNVYCTVDLLECSNSLFSKIFGCFNRLEVRPILHYIVYKFFVDTAQTGPRQRVHKNNLPF